ncbi:hypothetical protein HMPREF1584_00168 [Gardnerella vaginalis JCP8481A]|uniref:Uncharacterized protein n=1 Tax=Gardnerella vaginalis TaxID=2702 RepID=A0A133P2Y0_GARVA|nr:hypothetical protein HMPREF1585_01238 [Gardnerella vaginalis JCP8481B]EPI44796.1 hypothetical protein HMPREF1584_00168 [Gardnerella vaginalis JCP8481A]KXA22863.1 hypothetical protein HMPREF3208_00090 [Gardnerella vaginalis]
MTYTGFAKLVLTQYFARNAIHAVILKPVEHLQITFVRIIRKLNYCNYLTLLLRS